MPNFLSADEAVTPEQVSTAYGAVLPLAATFGGKSSPSEQKPPNVAAPLPHPILGNPSSALHDRVDLVGHKAVGLAVHGMGGIRAGGIDEAEHLAAFRVDPVADVVDAVASLDLQVLAWAAATSSAVAPSGIAAWTSM